MGKVTHGIRSIKIENFRGIDSLELNFEMPNGDVSDIVVIAGPNGCGKTTVLEACLHFSEASSQIIGSAGAKGTRVGQMSYEISAVLGPPYNNWVAEYTMAHGGHLRWRNTTTGKGKVSNAGDSARLPFLEGMRAMYIPSFRTPMLSGALPVVAGSMLSGQPQGGEDRYHWLKQYLVGAKVFEALGGSDIKPDRTATALTAKLTEAWKYFYSQDDNRFEVQMAGNGPTGGADLYLVTPTGRISTDNLSSGQLEVVAILGTLLAMEQTVHILVIDEPELHLDPQWHMPLVNAIRELLPNTQLILGTHSPRIYDAVYSFQRHLLVPDDDPRSIAWRRKRQEAEKDVVYES